MTLPHDITDLYLAPVALRIDAELETLADVAGDDVLTYIALATDREPRTIDERRRYFIDAVTRHYEMHGWVATCDRRGLRLTHGQHTIVLGLPAGVLSFLELADDTVRAG